MNEPQQFLRAGNSLIGLTLHWVSVASCVVGLLIGSTTSLRAVSPSDHLQPAIASLRFGDTRVTVYEKVSEDSRIQFVNPNITGAMGMGPGSPGQPGPSSLFLFNIKGRRLRLIFEFCSGDKLCGVELRGTSYDPMEERSELEAQYQELRSYVQLRYGPPSDTQPFQFEEIVKRSLPVWVHTWYNRDKRIVIRLGYQTRGRTRLQKGPMKLEDRPRTLERRTYTVFRKSFRGH